MKRHKTGKKAKREGRQDEVEIFWRKSPLSSGVLSSCNYKGCLNWVLMGYWMLSFLQLSDFYFCLMIGLRVDHFRIYLCIVMLILVMCFWQLETQTDFRIGVWQFVHWKVGGWFLISKRGRRYSFLPLVGVEDRKHCN